MLAPTPGRSPKMKWPSTRLSLHRGSFRWILGFNHWVTSISLIGRGFLCFSELLPFSIHLFWGEFISSEEVVKARLAIRFFMRILSDQIIGITSLYFYNSRGLPKNQDGMFHNFLPYLSCKREIIKPLSEFLLTLHANYAMMIVLGRFRLGSALFPCNCLLQFFPIYNIIMR